LQEIGQFLRDANSFVASSHEAITRSAPHIYVSALPFAPKDSLIYRDFAALCTGVINVETFGTDNHASRLVMTLTGHESRVRSVAYSSSGDLLAAGLKNGTVHIWDTRTGEEVVSPIKSSDGAVDSVAFASDGQHLASGTDKGVVSIWNVVTGQLYLQRPQAHTAGIGFLTFSPGRRIVASRCWNRVVGLWNMETSQIVSAPGHRGHMISLSFSSDGTVLTLRCWDSEHLWHIGAPGLDIQPSPFSEDNSDDTSTSLDTSKLSIGWDYESGLIRVTRSGRTVTLPTAVSDDVAFRISSDETCLAASWINYTRLGFWDLRRIDADPPLTILGAHPGDADAVSFSQDGKYIASGYEHSVRIWDASLGHEAIQRMPEKGITAVAVSPDKSFIACGRWDGSVYVSDIRDGETKTCLLVGHKEEVCSVSISPDGHMIASGSMDKTVRLWCVQTGTPIGEPSKGHRDWVIAVAFSPNSLWLASGSDDGTVLVWDVATGKIMDFAPMRCQRRADSVAFSSNGQALAAAGYNDGLYLWHLKTGQLVHRFQLEGLDPWAFSPDASRLLASDKEREGLNHVIDMNTGEQLYSTCKVSELYDEYASVSWSPCGRYVAIESPDHAVYLWDLERDTVSKLHGNRAEYYISVAFASDGQFLVSGADDGVIRLWDVKDVCSLALRTDDDPVVRLAHAELKDGWLIGSSGELLLWVPTDYQKHLQFTSYPMTVFGQRRIVVTVGDRGLHWGDDWHACWRGAVS